MNQAVAHVLQPWRRTFPATLGLYLYFVRLAFLKFLAYRLRYYTGVVSYTIFVAGHYYIYSALFASRVADMGSDLIGGLTIDPPLLLAPMAGYTQAPFRAICLGLGCRLVFTEVVTAEDRLGVPFVGLDEGPDVAHEVTGARLFDLDHVRAQGPDEVVDGLVGEPHQGAPADRHPCADGADDRNGQRGQQAVADPAGQTLGAGLALRRLAEQLAQRERRVLGHPRWLPRYLTRSGRAPLPPLRP